MITFDNVSKRYPGGPQALDQVSFELGDGEMAFLTGRSGAGKSTLLKLLMVMEKPSQGQILVDGKNLGRVTTPKDVWKVAGGPNNEIYVLTTYGHVVRMAADDAELRVDATTAIDREGMAFRETRGTLEIPSLPALVARLHRPHGNGVTGQG
jgi:ABC-type cobalamin/Fe3+-siderophores transport system ATPase subunit